MRFGPISGRVAAIGLALALAAPLGAADAAAKSRPSSAAVHAKGGAAHAGASAPGRSFAGRSFAGHAFASRGRHGYVRTASYGGRLQCVPFARENSGIELSGNASSWWENAEGVYQRGARPEVGSVLNFRANGRMRMGHVAVVANVVDSRNVEIDHANWSGPGVGRGGISRDITVVDVSERNDWSAVRVALGHTGEFGSVYPTYGFIYDRPDRGTMVANTGVAPTPVLNAAPRDLRPASERMQFAAAQDIEEVAEASDEPVRYRRASSTRHVRAGSHGSYGKAATVQRVKSGAAGAHGKHRNHRT